MHNLQEQITTNQATLTNQQSNRQDGLSQASSLLDNGGDIKKLFEKTRQMERNASLKSAQTLEVTASDSSSP